MADRGRPRGRARGRAQRPEQTTRPDQQIGLGPQQQQPPPTTRPQAVVSEAPVQPQASTSAGRAVQRGGTRGEPRQAPTVTQRVAEISLEGAGAEAGGGDDNGRRVAGRGASRGGTAASAYDPVVVSSSGAGKIGDYGTKVDLLANYFRVNRLPDTNVIQYHIAFDPVIESLSMRKAMMGDHRNLFTGYLFDGGVLWSITKLHQAETVVFSERRSDSAKIRITIKFVKEVPPRDPVIIQILNTQMRKNFTHIGFKLVGRDYFDMTDTTDIPQHKLKINPGFSTSIRQHETNVLMNCDLCFKITRDDSVYDLFRQIKSQGGPIIPNLEKQMLGQIVLTQYNNKTYKIDEVKWDLNPTYTFKKRDGSEMSLIDYMKVQWNLTVKDPGQPLLLSKPKARDLRRGDTGPILLIPEYCIMTGLTDEMREDYRVMSDVARYTRIEPTERVNRLVKFLQRLSTNQQVETEMGKWGMGFSRDLQKIVGRMIGPENIIMSANDNDVGKPYNPQNADWSNIVRGSRLLEPVKLDRWLLISTARDRNVVQDFVSNMVRVCPPMGMTLAQPKQVFCQDDRTGTFVKSLRENINDQVQMVVVVMPNQKKDRYDAIKKFCCIEYGVPSQVVVTRTLMKKQQLMSIATKIAIQMNCKLGGQVWRVQIPLSKLMVVGIDSYHDSAQKNMSVYGVVCSMNQFLTKYHSQVSFQSRGQEVGDALVPQLTACFRRYHELNRSLPERIMVFRDGVGDGQLPFVRQWEVKQLKDVIEAQGPDYKPKIMFIVVNKRIGTRLFQRDRGGNISNPLSGTVVDTEITRPERFDFYLISQSVRQGTVGPTQYNVIEDESNLRPSHVQRLTYKLCHLYFNWQGTIRVPAPCQYAHKLAFLVGQSLHADPSKHLADTLFYL